MKPAVKTEATQTDFEIPPERMDVACLTEQPDWINAEAFTLEVKHKLEKTFSKPPESVHSAA
jgi:hypothetical protein